ncbi:hypothetical protein ACVIHI_006069 [Bradyrhizobium sp. USDA 4524]|nr:hypothetical protein [Bradyrhizobium sp. USDA 4538]MCP1901576.1 hypothetical protein [Bradyrhizobium sp. USDA 4537]MCP1992768.1 hypothetical protein [Bradyrhizobium sp. USDA 4539]
MMSPFNKERRGVWVPAFALAYIHILRSLSGVFSKSWPKTAENLLICTRVAPADFGSRLVANPLMMSRFSSLEEMCKCPSAFAGTTAE